VDEPGSREVRDCIAAHESIATCTIARAEAAAAFARAAREGSLTESNAKAAHQLFTREWKTYVRIRVTESLMAKADDVAWTHRLKGYDAVHLSAALEWHHRMGASVTVATCDRNLRRAAAEAGLEQFPLTLS
jgi:predicted nucleic acid-binding protein